MIKRLRFATRRQDVPAEAFREAWPRAVAGAAHAPPDVRPSRVVACTTLLGLTGPDPKHDGIGIEWFTGADHLRRFEEWLATPAGGPLLQQAGTVVDRNAGPVVVAEESVMRGAEWLERRWRDGGERLKHMAIALRAEGLTPAEFSERWRNHAGQVRRPGAAGATVIPDDARGHAYVQNHPCPRTSGEWAYDAVNEVYFDDAESLRTRIEWFRENLAAGSQEDLVRRSWFIAVREEVVSA
ncbi:EthD domain-containing protein [Actinomadura scrupuli]|uniref:EthD domain-containing protein n=1 Tax=Actinomadura scrupuli TaxID=559629 RepID=UPI003D954BCE